MRESTVCGGQPLRVLVSNICLLHNYGFAPLIINTEACLKVTCYLEDPKWAWSEWGPPPTRATLISAMLDTVVRQLNIMSKVITFLHTGCSPRPAVRSALGCGPAVCSWLHPGMARSCWTLQQGLAGCAFLPCAFLRKDAHGPVGKWQGGVLIRCLAISVLSGRGLIIVENTRGTNRSRELLSFPSGSGFPASPWTGATTMHSHTLFLSPAAVLSMRTLACLRSSCESRGEGVSLAQHTDL